MKMLYFLTTTAGSKCSPPEMETIFKFINGVLTIIQIVVPIILIIVGAFDLAKAVMGNDEKEIKAATQKLIKRAIAAVAVFFISAMVTIVVDQVAKSDDESNTTISSWKGCWQEVRK